MLDFGVEVAGTPFLDLTAFDTVPTLTLATGEARQFLRRPAATTVAVDAAAGASTVTLASTVSLEAGDTITVGARTVSFGPALSADVPVGTAVSTSPGAPASDESRGLAGVGGIDTLQPTAPGRAPGTFHGGFRFILLTLTSPGSVSLSARSTGFPCPRGSGVAAMDAG